MIGYWLKREVDDLTEETTDFSRISDHGLWSHHYIVNKILHNLTPFFYLFNFLVLG